MACWQQQEGAVTGDGGAADAGTAASFGDLAPGLRVQGLTASGAAEVVAVEMHGEAAATIVYRTTDGTVDQQVVLKIGRAHV